VLVTDGERALRTALGGRESGSSGYSGGPGKFY
jgi:hypothetical protein